MTAALRQMNARMRRLTGGGAAARDEFSANWLSVRVGPLLIGAAWAVTTFVRGLGDIGLGSTNVLILGVFGLLIGVAATQYLVRPGPSRAVPLHGYALVFCAAFAGACKILVSPTAQIEIRFLAETLLITTVPIAVAMLAARKELSRTLATVLALSGGVAAVMVLIFILTQGPIVRRLDVQGALGIGLARNQLGHGFALSTVASVFIALRGRNGWRSGVWWALAALCMAAVVGTGSRSSVLGAAGGVGVLLLAGLPRRQGGQRFLLPIGLLAIGAATAWLASAGADELLLRRFTPELVGSAFEERAGLVFSSVQSMLMYARWWELLGGMSAVYYLPFRTAATPHWIADPHNVVVSALVFWGPFVALLVLLILLSVVVAAVRIGVRGRSLDHWFLLAVLLPSLIYSMSSGRLTRAFSIWVVIGIVWGQYYLMRMRSVVRWAAITPPDRPELSGTERDPADGPASWHSERPA